ncbi:MAG: MarR family transcriptional regulator [Pseudomonadota bacterium]
MTPDPNHDVEPDSKARLRLWLKLLKVTGQTEAELRRRLRTDHDTTLPRFDVMSALARHPQGLKMSELSTYLRVSNGNVTGIVDRLTEDGLALRVAVEGDRRAHLARLTPAGHRAFAELAENHEIWIDGLLGDLSAEDATTVLSILARVPDPKDGL